MTDLSQSNSEEGRVIHAGAHCVEREGLLLVTGPAIVRTRGGSEIEIVTDLTLKFPVEGTEVWLGWVRNAA